MTSQCLLLGQKRKLIYIQPKPMMINASLFQFVYCPGKLTQFYEIRDTMYQRILTISTRQENFPNNTIALYERGTKSLDRYLLIKNSLIFSDPCLQRICNGLIGSKRGANPG